MILECFWMFVLLGGMYGRQENHCDVHFRINGGCT